jgi:hypothetical protein
MASTALLGQSHALCGRSELTSRSASTGVVNIYESSEIASQTGYDENLGLLPITPKPLRELMNLTTSVSTMAFNHDAQILAIGSDKKKDAFRMVSRRLAASFSANPAADPPPVRHGVLQLANIIDAAGHGHRGRLFRRERVCRDWEYKGQGLVVWPQALQGDVGRVVAWMAGSYRYSQRKQATLASSDQRHAANLYTQSEKGHD